MKTNLHFLKHLTLLLGLAMLNRNAMAQTAIIWTGAVDSIALKAENWDPPLAPDGNDLTIDSAFKYTNLPVFNGTDSIEVNSLTIHPTGEMIIDFEDSLDLFDVATERFEPHGKITINRGTLRAQRLHIEDTNTVINVNNGGILKATKYFFMGGDNDHKTIAGYLNISGTGKAIYTAEYADYFGRFPTDTTTGVITLNPMGTLDIKGNYLDLCEEHIAKNQIKAADGFDVYVDYDAEVDWTYVYIRDANVLFIQPVDPVRQLEGEAGDTIRLVRNDVYDDLSSFQWKYATESGGDYIAFSPAETDEIINPVFSVPGHFYLVCEGIPSEGGTLISNEVEVYVGSGKVIVDPPGDQFLRAGLQGATLTVTRDPGITAVEWMWSNTMGGGYASFSPQQTGDEYTPAFETNGIYWVTCKGTDGSNTYFSKDVRIKVTDDAFQVYWNGSLSNAAGNAANWNPIANVDRNSVNVGPPHTYDHNLVFNGTGNMSIDRIFLNDSLATMTVDMGVDTLWVHTNSYGIRGQLIIESGVFSYPDLRHVNNSGRIMVKGGEFLIRESFFMMGEKYLTSGGFLDIIGDGRVISMEKQPERFSDDTTQSVIFITENGMLFVPGDWTDGADTIMAKRQLITSPGEELAITYPVTINGIQGTRITACGSITIESIRIPSCPGESNGSIRLNVSGGTQPYSYLWSNDETGNSISDIPNGEYWVNVTDNMGCSKSDTIVLSSTSGTAKAEICIVTLDTATFKNMIIWEKEYDLGIKSYKIYRQGATLFDTILIGAVPFDSLGIFLDQTSQPEVISHKYWMKVVDSCGYESAFSLSHQPMLLTTNLGPDRINLAWSEYKAEGIENLIIGYKILRSSSTMNYQEINAIPANTVFYPDINPPEGRNYYIVAAVLSGTCDPTGTLKAGAVAYHYSLSNVDDNKFTTDIVEPGSGNGILIYPNPFTSIATIRFQNPERDLFQFKLFNCTGKVLKTIDRVRENQVEINRDGMPDGIYLIELRGTKVVYKGKVIIE